MAEEESKTICPSCGTNEVKDEEFYAVCGLCASWDEHEREEEPPEE